MQADTLVIILHFGSLADTTECIDSLRSVADESLDILVVNNDPDPSIEHELKSKFPKLVYRIGSNDLGFAAGNNIGLRYSLHNGYAYSMLLNNDTIAETNFVAPLKALLEQDKSIAMVGPAIYCYPAKTHLWSVGGWVNMWTGSIAGFRPNDLEAFGTKKVDYLPGACILARNSVLHKVGLLNENYFLTVEEADWAVRVRAAGYKVMACSTSVLYHKVGVSSRRDPEAVYNNLRSRFLFLRDHHLPPIAFALVIAIFLRHMLFGQYNRHVYVQALQDHFRYKSIRRGHLERAKKLSSGLRRPSRMNLD